jgi:mRNA-degrading endonuclease RelE of RelBE toxin-antitoxin system
MQTVIETSSYLADAKAAPLTEAERDAIVDMIASNPEAGDEITGTGGARKVRVAGRGKGKSGGYRVITFYSRQRRAGVFVDRLFQGRQGEPDQSGKERIESLSHWRSPKIQTGRSPICLS